MPNRVICMVSLLAIIGVKPVFAMDNIKNHVPDAKKVGQARMSVMMWDIYDAVLIAPKGEWRADKPFALQLTYLRHLQGKKIADRAIQEIRAQGYDDEVKLATWHTQMRQIFPDVYEGDTISGIFTQDGKTIFFHDGVEIGRIEDAQFASAFSAIWLGPKTSAPDIRMSLLGIEKSDTAKGKYLNGNSERTGSRGTTRMY